MAQELKRIDVLSFAIVLGLVGAVSGLIVGILAALFGAMVGSAASAIGLSMGAAFGGLAIIIFPVISFLYGFIGGAIFAIIYNFVASKYKGIKIELK
ncbi:MAG: hypothetical protein J7J15_00405 [Candidatus Aenigmarchaeota archaeon]|nr:hypothetical protein [Candidatus Aenigmarchaeota archaeon]